MDSSSATSSTRRVTSYEWAGPSLLVVPIVLLLTSGQFLALSTSITHLLTSEEWAVPCLLVAPVVLLLKSGQFLVY